MIKIEMNDFPKQFKYAKEQVKQAYDRLPRDVGRSVSETSGDVPQIDDIEVGHATLDLSML